MARFRLPQRRMDRVLPVAALLLCAGFLIGRINIGRRQLEEFIQVFRDSLHPLGKGRFCIGFLP